MFHSAVVRLTVFYLLIVVAISLIFSIVLYNLSSSEIGRGLSRQNDFFQHLAPGGLPNPFLDLESSREQQLTSTRNRLVNDLFYFNLVIFALSGGLSYWLAKRTLKPIEEAMEAQNRFTGDASHELRTPLTAMKTEIEVGLRDQQLTLAEAKRMLSSNLEEIGHLESLSGALLKLARYDGNHFEMTKVDVENVIMSSYRKVEKLSRHKNIDFNFDLAEGSEVLGDETRLKELFVILFENAVKYSASNSTVKVETRHLSHHLVVKVSDQGIGIKASDLPHIFDRFYRADSSRSKEKVDGYGLGLAIAKTIVEHHHGKIEVESVPGQGTTFTITLS